jgi:hypothetical protein
MACRAVESTPTSTSARSADRWRPAPYRTTRQNDDLQPGSRRAERHLGDVVWHIGHHAGVETERYAEVLATTTSAVMWGRREAGTVSLPLPTRIGSRLVIANGRTNRRRSCFAPDPLAIERRRSNRPPPTPDGSGVPAPRLGRVCAVERPTRPSPGSSRRRGRRDGDLTPVHPVRTIVRTEVER